MLELYFTILTFWFSGDVDFWGRPQVSQDNQVSQQEVIQVRRANDGFIPPPPPPPPGD